jgi:hypothetical protein
MLRSVLPSQGPGQTEPGAQNGGSGAPAVSEPDHVLSQMAASVAAALSVQRGRSRRAGPVTMNSTATP